MRVANVRYELADGVKPDRDKQDAYKLPEATAADARRVADAFGVTGKLRENERGWSVRTDSRRETVSDRSKAPATVDVAKNGSFSLNGDYSLSRDVSCSEQVGADCPAPTTTIPPDMPTEAESRSIAETVLEKAGVTTARAKVTVENFGDVHNVRYQHTLDGVTTSGLEHSVWIGAGTKIAHAFGYLGDPVSVGSYELATPQRAVDRLNEHAIRRFSPEDDSTSARDSDFEFNPGQTEPKVLKLTAVRVGVMTPYDWESTIWLTPAYIFATDDGGEVVAPAAADKHLKSQTTTPPNDGTEPAPIDGGGGSTGSGGSTGPAAPSRNCANTTEPIAAQVCTDKESYNAGEAVRFTIDASDPDRAFVDGPCYDGVTVDYGDDDGEASCLACDNGVAEGPGKMSRQRTHTYAKAGTYTAKFTIKSGSQCAGAHPNDSTVTLSLPVRVA